MKVEEAKERVRMQGDRLSQIIYGLIEEYGVLTAEEVAEVVDVSPSYMYRVAKKKGGVVFERGRKPSRIES